MSNSGINHLDRDPKTGQLLPGHSVSNRASKNVAHKMTELKAAYYGAVSQEDLIEAHQMLMALVRQTKEPKVQLAAIALLFDRCLGKAEQNINVQSESRTLNANVNISPDEQRVLESIIAKNSAPTALPVAEVVVTQLPTVQLPAELV